MVPCELYTLCAPRACTTVWGEARIDVRAAAYAKLHLRNLTVLIWVTLAHQVLHLRGASCEALVKSSIRACAGS